MRCSGSANSASGTESVPAWDGDDRREGRLAVTGPCMKRMSQMSHCLGFWESLLLVCVIKILEKCIALKKDISIVIRYLLRLEKQILMPGTQLTQHNILTTTWREFLYNQIQSRAAWHALQVDCPWCLIAVLSTGPKKIPQVAGVAEDELKQVNLHSAAIGW